MWLTRLRRPIEKGARIVHGDGHVTECVALHQMEVPFHIPNGHEWLLIVPPGTKLDGTKDRLVINGMPTRASAKVITLVADQREEF
jgi:hypothetical protein